MDYLQQHEGEPTKTCNSINFSEKPIKMEAWANKRNKFLPWPPELMAWQPQPAGPKPTKSINSVNFNEKPVKMET